MPGPRKMLALSIVPATAFDAVSSTGVAASLGVRAACAGRKSVPTTEIPTVSAYTVMIGAWVSTSRAIAAVSTARTRSLIAITLRRGKRSASAASGGDASAAAIIRTSMMRATAAAPPDRNATTASAIT